MLQLVAIAMGGIPSFLVGLGIAAGLLLLGREDEPRQGRGL